MSKELKTGVVLLVVVVSFIWGFNFLKGHDLLNGKAREFRVEYSKIGGLTKASFVTLNGLKVGQVKKIELNTTQEKRGELIVTFTVENNFEFSKKSSVKIYSPNPLSPSNLAIIPNYEGAIAISGDTLRGEMEESLFTSIGERLDPLQTKIEKVLVDADTLFSNVNKILNEKTIKEINTSVQNLSLIIKNLKTTVTTVNSLVLDNQDNLNETLKNTKNITANLNSLSDSLSTIDFKNIIAKAENTIDNFNQLSQKINTSEGSLGKLINDDQLYKNVEAATKELEQLLRDLKTNPKRYVHFSLFGKKAKEYTPTENDNVNNTKN